MNKETTPLYRFKTSEYIKGAALFIVYLVLLPYIMLLVSNLMQLLTGRPISERALLLTPYYLSFALAALLFKNYFIDQLSVFTHHLGRSLGSMFRCYFLMYGITIVCAMVLLAIGMNSGNPNDLAVEGLVNSYDRVMLVMAVFLAPLVEELLFRGLIFGSLYKVKPIVAYIVSWLAFGAAHLLQYAIETGDWRTMIFMIEYLPPSIAWGWCYKRSGSIWTVIFMHMIFNAMGMAVMRGL